LGEYPDWLTQAAAPPHRPAIEQATARQRILTKPPGSLGQLEDLAIQLAGLLNTDRPALNRPHIILFAGDHGITAEGISAYPSEVTGQMLANFVAGGAAISVLARALKAELHVVDVGTLLSEPLAGIHTDKVAQGTRNFRREPALTPAELIHALEAGRSAAQRALEAGADILILGEMGIGNTSSASALTAALTDTDPARVVGAGTGLDGDRLAQKTRVISQSLAFHGLMPGRHPPLLCLKKVGGHEIAALTGAFIASAQAGIPLLVDGFICSAAALAAVQLNPSIRDWLVFSHRSAEPGHSILLDALDASPLFDLGLRLGEGSGAALALPLLQLACTLHNDMATFEDAGVSTSP